MDFAAQRRDRLIGLLADEGLDACLISSPVSVTYLTGFSGDGGALLLGPRGTVLVSDMRFTEQIGQECPGLEAHIRPPTRKLVQAVADTVGHLGCRTLGFESGHLTVADLETYRGLLPAVDWKGAADRVERLRMVKDAGEVSEIRAAIGVAERAFTALLSLIGADDTEKELHDAMEAYVRRAGGRATAFPTIIAVGERSALPHAPPTGRRVGDGEVLLVDWGASGRFYKSDLTRTLGVRKISPKLEEVYEVVLRAQQAALAAVRPGVTAGEVDTAARQSIADAGYGEYFGHGLGHGVGLEIHEAPWLRPGSDTPLAPGMVFTLEPGVYLPGWGGVRIEDDVLVTADGCEVLTGAPRALRAVDV